MRADLDTPVLDACLVAELWRAGQAAHDDAIGEPEGAAGSWESDAAIADRAFLQRAAHVSVQFDGTAQQMGPIDRDLGDLPEVD